MSPLQDCDLVWGENVSYTFCIPSSQKELNHCTMREKFLSEATSLALLMTTLQYSQADAHTRPDRALAPRLLQRLLTQVAY